MIQNASLIIALQNYLHRVYIEIDAIKILIHDTKYVFNYCFTE